MSGKINYKIIIKAAVIGVLLLLMLIPMMFVNGIISGRKNYRDEAVRKITDSWGGSVLIAAPVWNVVYDTVIINAKKQENRTTHYYKFTPADLNVKAELVPQVRYIGIFKVPVFTAKIRMTGEFKDKALAMLTQSKAQFISIEINNLKGMADTPTVTWSNGVKKEFAPSSSSISSVNVSQTTTQEYDDMTSYKSYYSDTNQTNLKILSSDIPTNIKDGKFDISFSIKGSGDISFVPLAKQNNFEITSPWTTPNFSGAFLPDTKTVNADGFKANWSVNYLASGIPTEISGKDLGTMSFKTTLLFSVDNYRNAVRAAKYAALFIGLTFLACFVFEISRKDPIHPFQYALVGLAMAVFYILLISISEFVSFGWAYLIAAGAIILLIAFYARYAVLKKSAPKQVLGATALLAFLYAYLYMLLQLEDLSLIFGAVGLFVGLAAVMYATRNINWYE